MSKDEEPLTVDVAVLYEQLAYLRGTGEYAGEAVMRAFCHLIGHTVDEARLDRLVERKYKPKPQPGYYPNDADRLAESYKQAWADARTDGEVAKLARRWLARLSPRQCEALGVDKMNVMHYLYQCDP